LGLEATRGVVLALSIASELEHKTVPEFDMGDFWISALGTSHAARFLAENTGSVEPDDAYTAGLVQDSGVLAMQSVEPERYVEILHIQRREPEKRMQEIEQNVLGTTHTEVGGLALRRWGVPARIWEPVAYHHLQRVEMPDELDGESKTLARILNLADTMTRMYGETDVNILREKVHYQAREEFGLSEETVERELESLDDAIHAAAGFFAFDPDGVPSYSELRAQGARRAAELTLKRTRAFQKYRSQVEHERKRLEEVQTKNSELRAELAEDDLTSLLTRGEFLSRFEDELARARRYSHPISVLFLDIDRFKRINDRFGHIKGDLVLRRFGEFLKERIRGCDIAGRFGGDEFAVVFPETELERAVGTAERLREDLSWYSRDWLEGMGGVTVSGGVVHSATISAEINTEAILTAADRALYAAKADGRNCVRHLEQPEGASV
jgi:diguanylate cyclase (GGDEF)-like protein